MFYLEHLRCSLFVKIVNGLICLIPDICDENSKQKQQKTLTFNYFFRFAFKYQNVVVMQFVAYDVALWLFILKYLIEATKRKDLFSFFSIFPYLRLYLYLLHIFYLNRYTP